MRMTRDLSQHTASHVIGQPPPLHCLHPAHQALTMPPRGGLVGGGVVLLGLPSTPGGSAAYGYLGMDITDPASWPRPFNPCPTGAWFVRWPGEQA